MLRKLLCRVFLYNQWQHDALSLRDTMINSRCDHEWFEGPIACHFWNSFSPSKKKGWRRRRLRIREHTNDGSRFVATYVNRLERSECTRFRYSMGINLRYIEMVRTTHVPSSEYFCWALRKHKKKQKSERERTVFFMRVFSICFLKDCTLPNRDETKGSSIRSKVIERFVVYS